MVTAARSRAAAPAHAAGPPPRTVLLAGALILLAVVLLAAVSIAVWQVTGHHGAAARDRVPGTVTGAVGGRHDATLELLSGVTTVTVSGADLGDTLYRVHTPSGPAVSDDNGHIGVRVTGDDKTVDIVVNTRVRWTVRFTAGASTNTADLRGVSDLAAVEYIGGVATVELDLPAPHGTLPVRTEGGANTVRAHVAKGYPVSVTAGGGAGAVTIDGSTHSGVAAGATFNSGEPAGDNQYTFQNTGGVSNVVIDRN